MSDPLPALFSALCHPDATALDIALALHAAKTVENASFFVSFMVEEYDARAHWSVRSSGGLELAA